MLNGPAWTDREFWFGHKISHRSRQVTFKMNIAPAADGSGSSLWPVTDWSEVGHAAELVGKDADRLNQLIVRYQKPLKVCLLSAFPSLAAQADEVLQDFAQDRILREGWLRKANRDRGHFRDFLKKSLQNFARDRLRKNANAPVPIDGLDADLPIEGPGPEPFDLEWVRIILAEVFKRMEADCKDAGKDQPRRTSIWEVFRLRMLQPALEDSEPVGYEEIVRQFGVVSPADAQNMLATAKRIFTRHLNAVIGEYEKGEQAVKAEIEELKRFLSGFAKGRTLSQD